MQRTEYAIVTPAGKALILSDDREELQYVLDQCSPEHGLTIKQRAITVGEWQDA